MLLREVTIQREASSQRSFDAIADGKARSGRTDIGTG